MASLIPPHGGDEAKDYSNFVPVVAASKNIDKIF
jgi:hypothetical protein